MKSRFLKNIFALFFLIGISSGKLLAFEVIQTDLRQYLGKTYDPISSILQEATESAPPTQMQDLVLFRNKPNKEVRYMGIAFAHEGYSKIHLFSRQKAGVFYYIHKISGAEKKLDYRLIVDGIWRADDTHKNQFSDSYGHLISSFDLNTSIVLNDIRPKPLEDGYIRFRYEGTPGQRVFLNTDVGSWDPFLFRMKEDPFHQGVYEVKIKMTPGEHYYYFIANGEKTLGEVSLQKRIHKIAGKVNLIVVK